MNSLKVHSTSISIPLFYHYFWAGDVLCLVPQGVFHQQGAANIADNIMIMKWLYQKWVNALLRHTIENICASGDWGKWKMQYPLRYKSLLVDNRSRTYVLFHINGQSKCMGQSGNTAVQDPAHFGVMACERTPGDKA